MKEDYRGASASVAKAQSHIADVYPVEREPLKHAALSSTAAGCTSVGAAGASSRPHSPMRYRPGQQADGAVHPPCTRLAVPQDFAQVRPEQQADQGVRVDMFAEPAIANVGHY